MEVSHLQVFEVQSREYDTAPASVPQVAGLQQVPSHICWSPLAGGENEELFVKGIWGSWWGLAGEENAGPSHYLKLGRNNWQVEEQM